MTRNILSERSHRLTDDNLNARKIVKSAVKARTETTCCFDHDISGQKYHDDWNNSYATERQEAHENCNVSSHSELEVSGSREVKEIDVELTSEQLIWRGKRRQIEFLQEKETGNCAKKKRDKESQNEKEREKNSEKEKERYKKKNEEKKRQEVAKKKGEKKDTNKRSRKKNTEESAPFIL